MGCGASVADGGALLPEHTVRLDPSSGSFSVDEGVTKSSEFHARLAMHMLFARYDKDASGEIDSTELLKMMKDTTRSARKRSGGWARNSAIDAALAEDRPAPRLRDVQEVMHAIGVDTSPGGDMTIPEGLFIEWLLGGMKRGAAQRRAFADESEVQAKMILFLECLIKMTGDTIAAIKFIFSDKAESDSSGAAASGAIAADDVFAFICKARNTEANKKMVRWLTGVKVGKGQKAPIPTEDEVKYTFAMLNPATKAGEMPVLTEEAFLQYMLDVFSLGGGARRAALQRNTLMVSLCGLLEFVKREAVDKLMASEINSSGMDSTDAYSALAFSSLFEEFDCDCDRSLNNEEFRSMVESCARRHGGTIESEEDEEAVRRFMARFDRDSDHLVTHDEFVQYMIKIMGADRKTRMGIESGALDDADGGNMFAILQQYVVDSVTTMVSFLEYAITELKTMMKQARRHARKRTSPVTANELRTLMLESLDALDATGLLESVITSSSSLDSLRKSSQEDAEGLLEFMDENADGKLMEGEIVESLLRFLMQTKNGRKQRLEGETKIVKNMLEVIGYNLQRRVLLEASRSLFRKYDVNLVGTIDAEGLQKLIEGCSAENGLMPPWEDPTSGGTWNPRETSDKERAANWSKVLFDEFDANGDGQLDEDEFIDAVVKKAMLKFLDNGANEDDDLGDMEEEMERDHQIEEMMLIIRKELPYLHV